MSHKSRFSRPIFRLTSVLLLTATLGLTACASANPSGEAEGVFDPLEPLNRSIYGLNEGADILLIGPASQIYREATPAPLQTVFRNIVRNLEMPMIAVNKLLQGDFEGTRVALSRFMVNSVAGVGGIADIATGAGLPYEDTDFGVTLASWGVESGPYLVLPLLGPSNFRDGIGRGVDWLADPVRLATLNSDSHAFYYAANALRALDARGGLDAVINDARTNSIDSYATLRSYFEQHRAAEVARQLGR